MARSAHVASAYQGRHLLVFGGGSVAHCFDNLFALDTDSLEWSEVEAEGPIPPPRAGAAVHFSVNLCWCGASGGDRARRHGVQMQRAACAE